jgi:two-component SAPR family response regulator
MSMLRSVLVDDEEIALERMEKIIREAPGLILAGAYTDADEALKNACRDAADLAFLDIEMPEMNGLELAERMMEVNPALDVIFVTAYDKYALQAFQTHAVGYLLKPVSADDIRKQVENLLRKQKNRKTARPGGGSLHVQCFGQFICSAGQDRERLRWRTAKAEELVAFLLHHRGRPVARDEIIEALWPEMDADRAAKNFHATSHYVRRAMREKGLGEILIHLRGSYELRCDEVQCDMLRFDDLRESARRQGPEEIEALEEMASLYQGAYLGDKGYDWALESRAFYEREFSRLQLVLAERQAAGGDLPAACGTLQRLLEHNPLAEEAHEKLILLYLKTGDRKTAVEQYKNYKKRLLDELGVQPADRLKELLKGLL